MSNVHRKSFLRSFALFLLAASFLVRGLLAQTIQVVGSNVGMGTSAPGAKLDVVGNQKLSGFLKFPSASGDADDGKIGNSLFAQGLNLVGTNNDSTYRKIQLWGQINQVQNNGTNQWVGANTFTGAVRFSAFGSGLLSSDGSGNLFVSAVGASGANTVLRAASNGYLNIDNWIRVANGTGMYAPDGDHAFFDGNYFQTRTSSGLRIAQRDSTTRGYVYFDGSENFGLLHKNGGWAVRTTPGITEIHNAFYTQLLYDSNNASYFVDPHGHSRLNEISPTLFQGTYSGADSGLTGARHYQWGYQEGGPWSHPYPDLILGYHTGLKLGAYSGYGGTRFYSDHPSCTSDMIFSVGSGDTHVRVTNNLYVGGMAQAATFRSTSSGRWKENVETLGNALAVVNRLRAVSYQWKSGTPLAGQKDIGFIAEEVDQVIPEIVGHESGTATSIDYGRVTSVLVEAVKEMDQRNRVAVTEFQAMRAEIATLQLQAAEFSRAKTFYLLLLGGVLFVGLIIGRRWNRA